MRVVVQTAAGFRSSAGQWAYLGFRNAPGIGGWDVHPFTIAAKESDGTTDTVTFLIKAAEGQGQFTRRVLDLASARHASATRPPHSRAPLTIATPARPGHVSLEDVLGLLCMFERFAMARKCRAFRLRHAFHRSQGKDVNANGRKQPTGITARLDGPYGSFSVRLQDYKLLVLVAGGIGVTPMASLLQELLAAGAPPGARFHLVWACRGIEPFTGWFPDLLARLQESPQGSMTLFDTSNGKGGEEGGGAPPLPGPGGKATGGRPDLPTLFQSLLRDHGLEAAPGDVAVLACGPAALVGDAQVAARRLGLAFHKETFLT